MPKTKGDDYHHPDTVACNYECYEGGTEGSSRVIIILCPFCEERVKTYLWSISGCGKSCECGAMFYSNGVAFKRAY